MPTDLFSRLPNIPLLRRSWHLARKYSRTAFIADPFAYADFAYRLDERLSNIYRSLLSRSYHPNASLRIDVPKSTLSVRPGTLLEIEDMIVLFAITLLIARPLDKKLPDTVYSWRVKDDAKDTDLFHDLEILHFPFLKRETIQKQIDIIEPWYGAWPEFTEKMEYAYEKEGYSYLAISDIAAYFENIDLNVLRHILDSHLPKQLQIINFLVELLEYWAWPTVHGTPSPRGIPQGNAVSSFLGNVYLLPLDQAFSAFEKKHDIKYFRYMDDVKIFAKDKTTAREALFLMNETLRTLRLNIQGSKTLIRQGEEVRTELFDGRIRKINETVKAIQAKKELTPRDEERFQKVLRAHLDLIRETKGMLKDKDFRLFRRLITGYTLLRNPGIMRIAIDQAEQNPDARLLDSCNKYFRFLKGTYRVASERVSSLLCNERELFHYQQAQLLISLRYLLVMDAKAWANIWRLARGRNIHWHARQQAVLLLSLRQLNKRGLETARNAYESENDILVKSAWVHCLVQLPCNEVEEIAESLTLSVTPRLQRIGQYLHGLLFDKTFGMAQIKSIFEQNREDILMDRLYVVEVISKSKDSKLKQALLRALIGIRPQITRALVRERVSSLIRKIKVETGGEQTKLELRF